jgi:Flp pilus assembly protein TadD
VLARLGRLDEAIAQFETAIAAAPRDPVPRLNLAAALEQRGDFRRAAELRARAATLGAR